MATITVYPSGYVSDDYAYESATGIENGYNSADNTTYATIYLTKGSGAETYIYYTFDLSAIPDGAVITSVSCSANVTISSTFFLYISSREMQLYSGTTAKGSSASIPSNAASTTITAGDWTRDELTDCRLKLYAKRGSRGASGIQINFYGASLTIEYAEPDIIPIVGNTTVDGVAKTLAGGYVNIDGIWKTIAKSYSNINGVWKPTYGIGDVVFKWKKYSVETVKVADGWRYPGTGDFIIQEYNDNAAEFEIARKSNMNDKGLAPTYGDNELISLDWGTVPHSTQSVGSTIVTDEDKSHVIYVKITDTTGWDTPRGMYGSEVSLNPNYVYLNNLVSSSDYNSDGTMKHLHLVTPIYNPTYQDVQGEYIEEVTSSDYNAYPDNGVQDGYWYVRQ